METDELTIEELRRVVIREAALLREYRLFVEEQAGTIKRLLNLCRSYRELVK